MDFIQEILVNVVFIVKLVAVAILLIGLFLCLKDLISIAFSKKIYAAKLSRIQVVKTSLGRFVLLGLEILIIADIIETVINPSFADIGRLGALVAIRTVISYFLNKEIKEEDIPTDTISGKD